MILLLGIFIAVMFLYGIKFTTGWNEGYLGREQSNAVKGFFILFLTLGHLIMLHLVRDGLYPDDAFNQLQLSFHNRAQQLVVVMFLFYSGYGVSESIKRNTAGNLVGGGILRASHAGEY